MMPEAFWMGDERHKKSPAAEELEPVTRLFVAQVKAALTANAAYNEQHGLKKGDRGYRIATHADLKDEADVDANQIKNMLGGVRPGTVTKKIGRSRDVPKIRRALGLPRMATIEVPADRAALLQRLAALSSEQFAELQDEIAAIEKEG
jgi:hypothetical protein